MKTIKTISTALALVVTFSFNAFAQSGTDTQSAEVQVYASAFDALVIDNGDALGATEAGNINFGNILISTAATIKAGAADAADDDNVGTGYHSGVLEISGSDVEITITVTNATLSDGANTVAFTTNAHFYPDGGAASAAITATTNGVVDLSGNTDELVIGGKLAAITTPGHYSTENVGGSPVTVTVSYN